MNTREASKEIMPEEAADITSCHAPVIASHTKEHRLNQQSYIRG